jgi:hypothetical protein
VANLGIIIVLSIVITYFIVLVFVSRWLKKRRDKALVDKESAGIQKVKNISENVKRLKEKRIRGNAGLSKSSNNLMVKVQVDETILDKNLVEIPEI